MGNPIHICFPPGPDLTVAGGGTNSQHLTWGMHSLASCQWLQISFFTRVLRTVCTHRDTSREGNFRHFFFCPRLANFPRFGIMMEGGSGWQPAAQQGKQRAAGTDNVEKKRGRGKDSAQGASSRYDAAAHSGYNVQCAAAAWVIDSEVARPVAAEHHTHTGKSTRDAHTGIHECKLRKQVGINLCGGPKLFLFSKKSFFGGHHFTNSGIQHHSTNPTIIRA
jgi:hypothetical protein